MITHIDSTPELFDLNNIIIIIEYCAHQLEWRSELPATSGP